MQPNSTSPRIVHLSQDPILQPVLATVAPYELVVHPNICLRLCASIMSQQLSTKVADVIYGRFLGLYGGQAPTPAQILDTPHELLRGIGLSNAKANYVRNVAQYVIDTGASDGMLYAMTDEEVMDFLLPIKGVGKWTVEMLLMFTLGRPDIFPADDLGIQQAMAKLYGLDMADKKAFRQSITEIAASWAPYRTYACFYLWKFKDAK